MSTAITLQTGFTLYNMETSGSVSATGGGIQSVSATRASDLYNQLVALQQQVGTHDRPDCYGEVKNLYILLSN